MSDAGAIALGALLSGYPTTGRYDEAVADGGPRPHWRQFLRDLSAIDAAEFARRQATARRMIRDNGVTYNVYDEAGGAARPWDLDVLPLLTCPEDWAALEAGVIQRARLADALLSDVYGPQRLIAQNVLPPHLVHGHPEFLRALSGIAPPGGVRVHLYAADVGRAADGTWTVLSQRVDAPSGVGYALENRIVVSQTFSELFRDCRVRRLAGFFQSFRDGVLGLAPAGDRRAVLLTPGPYNEAYFEHAFLAHYLGLTLVEGEDLSVLDGRVYLETVGGLEQVDVIFRRVDSGFCDPLELRPDSALGVPGLVEAVRAGTVVVANALGAAVAESPALAAFLPRVCRALLDDELLLPGTPTIWCGTGQGRVRAMESLDRLVVRDAFDDRPLFTRGSTARIGADLSAGERRQLAERMTRRGAGIIAQEMPTLGVAPIRDDGRMVPRPVALRVFAAWTPAGYVVMPGGLARVAPDDGRRALSMQSGAASKDIWVLSDVPLGRDVQPQTVGEPMPIRRVGDEAPSRAMDNLLWLGRYAERAEGLVRTVRAIVLRLGDDAGSGAGATGAEFARRMLVPMAQASEVAVAAAERGDVAPLAAELEALVLDRAHPYGLRRLLDSVERTAWKVRDRLSVDTWRAILAFAADRAAGDDAPVEGAGLRAHLDTLVRRSAALSGLSAENMTRGRNWLFLDLGRRIERAVAMGWLARQMLAAPETEEGPSLQFALEVADSAMTYRYRYRGSLQAAPVIDLLLLDATNPRSLAFQAATLAGHVNALPRIAGPRGRDVGDAVDAMQDVLGTADPEALARLAEDGGRFGLAALLDYLADVFPRISDAVEDAYFRHSTARRTGSAPRQGR